MEPPSEKKVRLHYGSLEEQERARLEAGDGSEGDTSVAVQEGILAGNINITPGALPCAVRWLCTLVRRSRTQMRLTLS